MQLFNGFVPSRAGKVTHDNKHRLLKLETKEIKKIYMLIKEVKKKHTPQKKPNNEDHKSNFLYVRFAKVNFYVVWWLYDALLKSCVFNIELFFFL